MSTNPEIPNTGELYQQARQEFSETYDTHKIRPLSTEPVLEHLREQQPTQWLKTDDIETQVADYRITAILNVLEKTGYLDEPLGQAYPIQDNIEEGMEKLHVYATKRYEERVRNAFEQHERQEKINNALNQLVRMGEGEQIHKYEQLLSEIEEETRKPLQQREKISEPFYDELKFDVIREKNRIAPVEHLLKALEKSTLIKRYKENRSFQVKGNHTEYQLNRIYMPEGIKND